MKNINYSEMAFSNASMGQLLHPSSDANSRLSKNSVYELLSTTTPTEERGKKKKKLKNGGKEK